MQFETLRARVFAALEALRHNDGDLLEIRCHERSIAGRLQVYLNGVFPSHNVDIEYNRHGVESKHVALAPGSSDDPDTDALVVPDIVIHRRRDDDANMLVIELKMDNCSDSDLQRDRRKLAAIRSTFGYAHSLMLQVPSGPEYSRRPSVAEWDGTGQTEQVV